MQQIFIEKPYRFVKPVTRDWIPRVINHPIVLRPLLWFTESIVNCEVRGSNKLKASLDAGDACMLIPNHPRTSDPVVMYRLLQNLRRPMFVMASWHLFNRNWFDSFAIPLMGGFSVNREGFDKASISFAVSSLQEGRRPLLVFPEGSTSRTNDSLMPFLDGPTFVARSAARKRYKSGKRTLIYPVAMRYLFIGDFEKTFDAAMLRIEKRMGYVSQTRDVEQRLSTALQRLVKQKAEEFDVAVDDAESLFRQRQILTDQVLATAESRWFGQASTKSITSRIRNLRARIFPEMISNRSLTDVERADRWRDLERTYLAWQMSSYPRDYFSTYRSVDRALEIASKIDEDLTDIPRKCGKQKAVIQVGEPIEVPAEKFRGDGEDPLMISVRIQLEAMMQKLQSESAMVVK